MIGRHQPSRTRWCPVQTSACTSSARRNSARRDSGASAGTKPRRRSSRRYSPSRSSDSSRSSSRQSSTAIGRSARRWTTWTGRSESTQWIAVRSAGCRAITRRHASAKASRSSSPTSAAGELLDVGAGLGLGRRVEEHALLDRRQRVDVLDLVIAVERVERGGAPKPSGAAVAATSTGALAARRDRLGEAGDRRVPEQQARVESEPGLPRPRGDLDHEDRVEPQLEEVVVDPDPGHAEDLAGDPLERPLDLVPGRDILLAARPPPPRPRPGRGGRPCRWATAAAHRARRWTQAPSPRAATRGASAAAPPGRPSAPGSATTKPASRRSPASSADDHGGLADGPVPEQGRLDLARLDADAADLHLVVGPAEQFERAVGAPPREVARAVEPRAGRAERVGQEPLGRRARAGPGSRRATPGPPT